MEHFLGMIQDLGTSSELLEKELCLFTWKLLQLLEEKLGKSVWIRNVVSTDNLLDLEPHQFMGRKSWV